MTTHIRDLIGYGANPRTRAGGAACASPSTSSSTTRKARNIRSAMVIGSRTCSAPKSPHFAGAARRARRRRRIDVRIWQPHRLLANPAAVRRQRAATDRVRLRTGARTRSRGCQGDRRRRLWLLQADHVLTSARTAAPQRIIAKDEAQAEISHLGWCVLAHCPLRRRRVFFGISGLMPKFT